MLRVSYLTTGGVWRYAGDNSPGLFDTVSYPVVGTRVTANSWSTIDPVSLSATMQWSSSIYNAGASAGSQYKHSLNGTNAFGSSAMGATVTVPRLRHQPRFGQQPLCGVGRVAPQHLHRHLPAQQRLNALVDAAHGAFADARAEQVLACLLARE